MPMDSLGIDSKMSVDADPKTYSPMSCSDENMSSPPSVLTTASAGSCTPSSLPSAGSTPSSIPSAGSTPYQFVAQEESSAIKLDSQDRSIASTELNSVHLCQSENLAPPYQEILDQNQPSTPDLQSRTLENESLDKTLQKSPEPPVIKHKEYEGNTLNSDISETLTERREDCSCIICDDKVSSCASENKCERNADFGKSYLLSSTKKPKNKSRSKKSDEAKSFKRNHEKILYKTVISDDPLKLKIKFTSSVSSHNISTPHYAPPVPAQTLYNELQLSSLATSSKKKRASTKGRGVKRKSDSSSPDVRKRRKVVGQFVGWGPVLSEVNGKDQSPWGYRLPQEILRKIFNLATRKIGCIPFLPRASKVCRLWHQVANESSLWYSFDLPAGVMKSRFKTEKKLLWLIENRLLKVQELNLAGWSEALSTFTLQKIGENCKSLVGLNIAYCSKLHSEDVSLYLNECPALQRIDMTNIMGAHKPTPRCAVGQQTLSNMASVMKERLTHLIIAGNTLSNLPSIINSLSTHCSKLQVLDLSSVETLGRDSVRLDLERLQNFCPKLRILRMAYSLFRLTSISMSAQVMSPGFPDLEELSLAVDDKVDIGMNDGELERILKNSEKLRLLDVRGCHNITDSSLVRISPWNIEHLFLAGGSTTKSYSDRLELVVRKWRHSLSELDLSWTGTAEAVDAALFTVCEDQNDKLKILNLCGSSVTFEPIRRLLSKCLSLQYLNLTSCRALPRGLKRAYACSSDIEKLVEDIMRGKFDTPIDSD